uniref:Dynein light chain n=1 Tax=Steinernema glaseri TaxID=37863 RepID=A0A1I8A9B6_9BILA
MLGKIRDEIEEARKRVDARAADKAHKKNVPFNKPQEVGPTTPLTDSPANPKQQSGHFSLRNIVRNVLKLVGGAGGALDPQSDQRNIASGTGSNEPRAVLRACPAELFPSGNDASSFEAVDVQSLVAGQWLTGNALSRLVCMEAFTHNVTARGAHKVAVVDTQVWQ